MLESMYMQGALKTRILLSCLSVIVVIIGTIFAIKFAKGYRPDLQNGTFRPTGIINMESYPESAKVYINGEYKTITKDKINLDPGIYDVEIRLDGFVTWKKQITIEPEVVSNVTAWLFPSVPSLKAITSNGASMPVISPDGTKIAYIRTEKNSNKLYTLDLTESAFGFISRDPKEISTDLSTPNSIRWSPDSRQILYSASASAILIDTNGQKTTPDVVALQKQWQTLADQKEADKFANLPEKLQQIFATSSANVVWSPKEDKIMYTATASAVIAENIIPQLPGSSSQIQQRTLVPNHVYIYDVEEDRNFLIDTINPVIPTQCPPKSKCPNINPVNTSAKNNNWQWFPTSNHIIRALDGKITIMEYDAQNATTVYAGPMESNFIAPYPSTKQVLILSNLNPTLSLTPNLYAVSLR